MARKKQESTIIQVPEGFNPYPHQQKVYDEIESKKAKRTILVWHRRAGKDIFSLCYMFMKAAAVPGLYGYFFPTYTQARKAIWEGIDSVSARRYIDYMPKQLIRKLNENEQKIELTNGSIIRFFGTDDWDSIRGFNPIGCVFSEFAYQAWEAWSLLVSPVLTRNQGWAIFNSTPNGPDHFYGMYVNATNNDKWVTSYLTIRETVNHDGTALVPEEEIEELRSQGIDEDAVQQEYYCNWRTGTRGTLYGDCIQKARDQGRIGDFPAVDEAWVETYWDLGFDDDVVVWFAQRKGLNIYLVDYYEDRGKHIDAVIEVLKDKGYKYKAHYMPHDARNKSLHPETVQELATRLLAQAGLKSPVYSLPRPLAKQDVISSVRTKFSRFYFNEHKCGPGLKKLTMYRRKWDPRLKIFSKDPVKDGCQHAADAFGAIAIADDQGHHNEYAISPSIVADFDIWGKE